MSRPFTGLANEQACEQARPQRAPDLRVRCSSDAGGSLFLEPLGNDFELTAGEISLRCWFGPSGIREVEAIHVVDGVVFDLVSRV